MYKAFPSTPLMTAPPKDTYSSSYQGLWDTTGSDIQGSLQPLRDSNYPITSKIVKHLKAELLARGFKTCPNDDKIISKVDDDGSTYSS